MLTDYQMDRSDLHVLDTIQGHYRVQSVILPAGKGRHIMHIWSEEFHSYIFGNHFLLFADHKPLLEFLREHRSTSPQALGRIRLWSLSLVAYEYTFKCRGTLSYSNAKAFSRLLLPVTPVDTDPPPEVILLLDHMAQSPVTAQQIHAGTCKDALMATVLQYIHRGWPANSLMGEDLHLYSSR